MNVVIQNILRKLELNNNIKNIIYFYNRIILMCQQHLNIKLLDSCCHLCINIYAYIYTHIHTYIFDLSINFLLHEATIPLDFMATIVKNETKNNVTCDEGIVLLSEYLQLKNYVNQLSSLKETQLCHVCKTFSYFVIFFFFFVDLYVLIVDLHQSLFTQIYLNIFVMTFDEVCANGRRSAQTYTVHVVLSYTISLLIDVFYANK